MNWPVGMPQRCVIIFTSHPHCAWVEYVYTTSEASTGVAPITVDAEANNIIVIVPGANYLLTPEGSLCACV